MRYDVKKFLFIGMEKERELFFRQAQEVGVIHFIETGGPKETEVPDDVQDNMTAIKILRGFPPMEQEEVDDFTLADGLMQKIIELRNTLNKLMEEQRVLRLEIARVEAFGNFSLKDIEEIEKDTGRKVQYYFAKEGYAEKNPLPDDVVYVGTAYGLDYFIAFNKMSMQYPKMVEMHIQQPLNELKKRLQEVTSNIHHTDHRLKGYAKYNTFLHHALIHRLNSHNLKGASDDAKTELGGSLFVVEGWVPVNKIDALQPIVKDLNVHMEEIAFDPKDVPPTYLENEGLSRLGEDLVHIYDTPSNTDKDPSLFVLFFFALFFAFIVGDGGYGLIFLGVALYVRSKYTLSKAGHRFIKLTMVLGAACLIWGLLTASFFGISLSPDNPLRKMSVLQWLAEKKMDYMIKHQTVEWKEWMNKFPLVQSVTDPKEFIMKGSTITEDGNIVYEVLNKLQDSIMFELAVLIGVIHLSISLLRYTPRNPSNFGWFLFLVGAYLYFSNFLQITSIVHVVFGVDPERGAYDGMYLMIGGIGLATGIALFRHKLLGILEPMAVIQLFADTMSYLRLYALGLSGAMLVGTMNDLASSVNLVFGTLILVAGHITNIVLSIMGGTIHGLRLNFLEWYHYSFEGGGKPFNPLRKLTTD